MIPILYESNETIFSSNGLGRLRDCISCIATEERNGIYECDFEYPVNGERFRDIVCGRIIAAEHDVAGDVQPFDIVSYSAPINGIVKFHAQHICYRQSKLVAYGTNVNTLYEAFALLDAAIPSNPFQYSSDYNRAGSVAVADGEPRTVKSILGGVEGSILDTYGGEYTWNKFSVKLSHARGEEKDITIRYGVNLRDYNDDTDYSETYSSIIPYWKGTGENNVLEFIIGDKRNYRRNTITGRGETIPVDLTEYFGEKPTKAEVTAKGTEYIDSRQPVLPVRNIKIEFAQLEQSDEYRQYRDVFSCALCDSINVIFPMYKMSGKFKIVKTEWDVLAERYKSMELGALPTTLSQALGLSK